MQMVNALCQYVIALSLCWSEVQSNLIWTRGFQSNPLGLCLAITTNNYLFYTASGKTLKQKTIISEVWSSLRSWMLTAKALRECQCFDLLDALCDLSWSMQNSWKVLVCSVCFPKVGLKIHLFYPIFIKKWNWDKCSHLKLAAYLI